MSILASSESPDFKPIQPLHNPSLAAQVVVPKAPIGNGNSINQAPGMGAKALFAKKLARNGNPVVSPTDNLLTPCSATLAKQKQKHFLNAKPVQLFPPKSNVPPEENDDLFTTNPVQLFPQIPHIPQEENDESSKEKHLSQPTDNMEADSENPF